MSSARSCPTCQSSDFEQDPSRGEVYCSKCGHVIESNNIVSELQFEEGSGGGCHVIGQHVGETGTARPTTAASMFGSQRESRHVTLQNARKKIKAVAAQLRLNNYCTDVAFNFYKRALQKRLTHGRKNTHVIAACIYITCRVEQTCHMLLDLSDIMQVNVYELGRTYLKLSSSLHINIPAIDPCIYIVRYASKLDLGDKTHEIEQTAMRIAQRMKRDWMHFGRRPSGLCGSALLVAARMHDAYCSVKEIISVVKVCEATIRKRLSEFGDTPTSRLTLDQFMTINLEEEEDPPCFKAARKKQIAPITKEVETSVSELEKQIEEELEKARMAKKKHYAAFFDSKDSLPIEDGKDEDRITEEIVLKETMDTVSSVIGTSLISHELHPSAAVLKLNETFGLADPQSKDGVHDNDDNVTSEVKVDSGELFTDDLDDNELDSYILDDRESSIKKMIWEKVNADWIKMSEEKARRKAEEEAELKLKESKGELPPPKKKRRARKKIVIQANSAGEAIEKMLTEKRLSNKINYEALGRIPDDPFSMTIRSASSQTALSNPVGSEKSTDGSCDINSSRSTSTFKSPAQTSTVSTIKRLPSIRNFVPSHIRVPTRSRTASTSSSVMSRFSESDNAPEKISSAENISTSEERSNKRKGRDENSAKTQSPAKRLHEESEVEEVFDDDDEEDEEPSETHISIAQLMAQRMGAGEGNDDLEEPLTDHDDY